MVRQQADWFLGSVYSITGHFRSRDREGDLWLFVEGSWRPGYRCNDGGSSVGE